MESLIIMTHLIYELEIHKAWKKSGLFRVTSWKTQGRVTIKVHIYLLILLYSFIIFSVKKSLIYHKLYCCFLQFLRNIEIKK